MSKSWTKEQVASDFSAGAAVNAGGSVADSGKLDTQAFNKQMKHNGGDFNKQSDPVRNGTAKTFDDAKDRGPSISAHAGMKPQSMTK
jgi:hypothetical protein